MTMHILDFEKNIYELERKLAELKQVHAAGELDVAEEIVKVQGKWKKLLGDTYARLTPWQKVLVSRHPNRPYTMDYINIIFQDFMELHGDRLFRDDPSIVGGLASLEGISCVVMGHQKGRTTKEKIYRNFGSPHPEGYRKAMRLMSLAERFHKPLITFIDTPGAYPGIESEERGQAEAIAACIATQAGLKIPIISIIIGEGGSGGALALAVGDRVLMLEFATYSVISPEGCSSILWRAGNRAEEAAGLLKLTAADIRAAGVCDDIVPETLGGAHRNPEEMGRILKALVITHLKSLMSIPVDQIMRSRRDRIRAMGPFIEK